jgi:hypothetical protein
LQHQVAGSAQSVDDRSQHGNGCAAVIVVHHRLAQSLLQFVLDVEAIGCAKVLEMNPAERRRNALNAKMNSSGSWKIENTVL